MPLRATGTPKPAPPSRHYHHVDFSHEGCQPQCWLPKILQQLPCLQDRLHTGHCPCEGLLAPRLSKGQHRNRHKRPSPQQPTRLCCQKNMTSGATQKYLREAAVSSELAFCRCRMLAKSVLSQLCISLEWMELHCRYSVSPLLLLSFCGAPSRQRPELEPAPQNSLCFRMSCVDNKGPCVAIAPSCIVKLP